MRPKSGPMEFQQHEIGDPGDPGIIGVELQRRSGEETTRVTVNISKM